MYEELTTIHQKRLALEEVPFEEIDIDFYYSLCDQETNLRQSVFEDMNKKHIEIHEDKYSTIKVVDNKLEVTIKDFQP